MELYGGLPFEQSLVKGDGFMAQPLHRVQKVAWERGILASSSAKGEPAIQSGCQSVAFLPSTMTLNTMILNTILPSLSREGYFFSSLFLYFLSILLFSMPSCHLRLSLSATAV